MDHMLISSICVLRSEIHTISRTGPNDNLHVECDIYWLTLGANIDVFWQQTMLMVRMITNGSLYHTRKNQCTIKNEVLFHWSIIVIFSILKSYSYMFRNKCIVLIFQQKKPLPIPWYITWSNSIHTSIYTITWNKQVGTNMSSCET